MNEKMASRILRTLPREKAFYFFTSIGNYTGESASSLKEFVDRINEVAIKSLEFHLNRGDFERWIDRVLEDRPLAMEIRDLRGKNYSGVTLRRHLYHLVAKRYNQLNKDFG